MNQLHNYATVWGGHPFRGSVPETANGTTYTIQMRDVSISGGVTWSSVAKTSLQGRKAPDWLNDGDILFLARGTRNFAVCLANVPGPTVCSQCFFLIRVEKANILLPEFLAWQMNQLPAQRYFASNAEGSDQTSIRRGVLECLPIVIPSLEQQQHMLSVEQAARSEKASLEALIHNREQQVQLIAKKLLTTCEVIQQIECQ